MENFEKWLQGIPYEVSFWESYYGNKNRIKDLFYWSMYDKPCRLDDFNIDDYVSKLQTDNPKILDVGCALSYMFGNIINNKYYKVQYIDPLASFYNKILKKYKVNRPEITFGMVEGLSFFYNDDSIDFIHIRNALDHSADPFLGIIQSLKILKKGGVLYLNHFINEAENEGYRGFHQFNLMKEQDSLIIWNESKSINVTKTLKDFATVTTSITPENRLVSVIVKHNNLPDSLFNDKEYSREIVENYFKIIDFFYNFKNSSDFQIKKLYTKWGHKFMRLLPYSLLNKIKKLASKQHVKNT